MATPLRPLPPGAAAGGRRRLRPQTVLLFVAGIVAINLLVAAAVIGGRDEGPGLPSAIEAVLPVPGTGTLAQDEVVVDLIDSYIGVLLIDGAEIPEDQLRFNVPLGQVAFRPGAGKDIVRLEEGLHSATIVYWPQDRSREEAARSYTWSFRVH